MSINAYWKPDVDDAYVWLRDESSGEPLADNLTIAQARNLRDQIDERITTCLHHKRRRAELRLQQVKQDERRYGFKACGRESDVMVDGQRPYCRKPEGHDGEHAYA